MAYQFKNSFNKGINLDLDQTRLPPNAVLFLKNVTQNVGPNPNNAGGAEAGSNELVLTPLEGNAALTISGVPSGVNYCIGFYSSEQTNEGYFALWNESGNHTVWVVRGDTGDVVKVHQSSLLPFTLDPEHFLSEGRMTLELKSVIDPVTEEETNFKLLVFTNNQVMQIMLDVEASIATNSYNTLYFLATASFYNRRELLSLGATLPLKTIGLNTPTPYTPVAEDLNKQNLLINNGWQFRIRTWDVWGRPSDWGIISSVYTVLTGSGCIATSNGLARCVNVCFDAGNPLVKFITVAYRRGVGNDPSGSTETGWYEHETFRKYDDSAGNQWYARTMNPIFTTSGSGITFDSSTNIISYSFCADKLSNPIDPVEASFTEPGLPRFSGSTFSVNKSLGLADNVYGFQPVSQSVIDAIDFSVKTSSVVPCDAAPVRTITVFANLYNPWNDSSPLLRSTFDVYTFGDGNASTGPGDVDCTKTTNFKIGQVFGDQEHPGFIAYLAGTPYKVIGAWGDYNPTTGVFTENSFPWSGAFAFPNIKMTRFTFVGVPAGKYVIRLASHHATINDGDLQKTSTQVAGIASIQDALTSLGRINGYSSNPIKEIEVDCTSGDINLGTLSDPMFVILDLNDGAGSNGIDGYLYEEAGASPVEMAVCDIYGSALIGPGRQDGYGSYLTDHNGYYFMATSSTIKAFIDIYADFCDVYGLSKVYSQTSGCGTSNGKMMHGDGQSPRNPDYWGNNGNWKNQVYVAGATKPRTTFPIQGRRTVRQTITECATSIGIPGIPLVLTKCQPALSDSNGQVTLIAHNRYNYLATIPGGVTPAPYSSNIPDYSSSPANDELVIYSQKGGCQWNECGTCATSISDVTIPYLDCSAFTGTGCSVTGRVFRARVESGGVNFAIGNTANIAGGGTLATINITGVVTGGIATSIAVTFAGDGYGLGVYSAVATSGSGTGLTIRITEIDPPLRTVCLSPLSLNPNGIGIAGLQSGGKYPVAAWFHDFLGRHTSPQVKMGEMGYVTVPNLTDITPAPYPSMSLCSLQVTIPSSITVDPVFTKLTFLVGANVIFRDYFSWAADWVQYVDNTGETNNTNPTSIRIYFQSLNEYNKQYNFKTNVAWDFIAQSNSDGGVNDVVQFIMNGDGTWLPSIKGAPVTYDRFGSFFTVDFQPELAGLQNGCLFRVIRPKQNTTGFNLPYYEQCLTLNITNGLLPAGTYTIPYVDSYLLSRSIPVPILKGQLGPVAPGAPATGIQYTSVNQDSGLATSGYSQNNVNNNNAVVVWQTTDYQTTFPFFFESPSPSDLWGSHLSCQGRIGIPNPYEMQFRVGTEIAMSNPISDKGVVNGIGTFLSQNRQVFDRNTWGNITAVLVETSVILVICDRDHFVVRYNGSTVRVDGQGNLIAQNSYGMFTSPERKAGTNYGCSTIAINTIRKYAGIVRWVDITGYVVIHNFSTAESNTDEAGYLGYMLNLLGEINAKNNNQAANGKTYLIAGIDVKGYEYYVTKFNIPILSATPAYLNTVYQPTLTDNVTMVFDLRTSILKGFAGFTPEYYGLIPGFYSQRQFLTFKQGVPYIHHWGPASAASQPPYANFYDSQCEVRITHVINGVDGKLLPDKVKRFLWEEVYCKQSITVATSPPSFPQALFHADIITSEKGQLSRLMITRWTLRDGYQTASFLCDLNTPADSNIPVQTGIHAILDGNQLQGRWLQVSLTNNPEWLGTYFEVSSVAAYIGPLEKSAE